MRAEALTPADIFGYHVRYVVPLFQRPYVWTQADQWEPLWDDVRAVAERLLERRLSAPAVAPHFLGAIVVEQAATLVGSIQVYHVIDGQQRLTTLQLLLDAAARVTEKHGDPEDARRLRQLVVNDPAVRREDEAFKVWPTLGDREAYLAAMSGGPSPSHSHGLGTGALSGLGPGPSHGLAPGAGADVSGSSVTRAHAFFVEAILTWAQADGGPDATGLRLHGLATAIGRYLRAVVIHLDPGDNAQGIFETLNHRGAPLLAADLIKNLIFRVAQAQGLDVINLYQRYWSDLDGAYWRAYVKRGRQVLPRIDVFVNYWLIMRLVREVRGDQIFASFRDHLGDAGPRVEELLRELAADARTYEAIGSPGSDPVPGLFGYRVFQAMDTGALAPAYLWLMRWPDSRLSVAQRDRALHALESWVVRRWLCGLTTKDTSNLVLDLVAELHAAGPEQAGDRTVTFLFRQRAVSRLWPDDATVARAMRTLAVDAPVLRPRLRMLLEAVEDRRRVESGDSGACERDLAVEHIMPQSWREHWAPEGIEPATATLRDTLVHTLGNLTLVRSKFNDALANLPWTDADADAADLGPVGKRSELVRHTELRINEDLVESHPDAWDEHAIASRAARLAAVLVEIWGRPAGGVDSADGLGDLPALLSDEAGLLVEPTDDSIVVDPSGPETPASPAGKYGRLTEFLRMQSSDPVPMTFEQVQDVLDEPLPAAARTNIPYWSSSNFALGRAIAAGGFKPTNVDLWNERVIFARDQQSGQPRRSRPHPKRRGGRQSGLDR